MTDWQTFWFALMAVAMAVMAVAQVAVLVQVARTAREVSRTAVELRHGITPLIAKMNRIVDDAARGTALAVAQVERVDTLLATVTTRVDEMLLAIKNAVVEPLRQGSAVAAIVKAVIAAFRRPERREADDEDPLFVG